MVMMMSPLSVRILLAIVCKGGGELSFTPFLSSLSLPRCEGLCQGDQKSLGGANFS